MSDIGHETPSGREETRESPSESGALDHFATIGAGSVLLTISLFLTGGLFLEQRPEGVAFPAGFGEALVFWLLLAIVWLLTAGSFLSASSQGRFQRISEWCHTAACGGLWVFLFVISLRAALNPPPSDAAPPTGHATLAVLFGFVPAVGLLSYLRQRWPSTRASAIPSKHSASFALFWPLLLLLKAPVIAVLFFVFVGGTAYLGERIGGRIGHPLLGACGGLVAVTLGLAAILIVLHRVQHKANE